MTTYDFNLITAFANSAPSNEIEPFPNYDRGLGIAFDETDGKPEMKGLNGLFSLMTVSLLALKQRGILTWATGFEYKQGAFVVEADRLYQAKIDNTSKQPSLSQNEWQVWASVSDIDVDTNGNIIKTAKVGGAFTLKVNDASTTVKGVARFANPTEVINKSNVQAFVNPSNIPQMFSGGDSFIELPNGCIFQWFTGTIPNNVKSWIFNLPKPLRIGIAQVVVSDAGFGAKAFGTTIIGQNSIEVFTSQAAGSSTFRALVIGY